MKCTRMLWLSTMSSLELMTLSYHFPAAIPEIPYRVLDSHLRVFSLGMKVTQNLFLKKKKKISAVRFNLYFPVVVLLTYRHFVLSFSNSLITHQLKQRKSQAWRRFVYLVLISIDTKVIPGALNWSQPKLLTSTNIPKLTIKLLLVLQRRYRV